MESANDTGVYDKVKDYYGHTIQTTDDLATNACTMDKSAMTRPIREATALIHPEIIQK